MVNPDYVIDSDQLDFYTVPEHAYFYGPTTITGENSVVYCERGFYDTANDTGYFIQNSRIDYDNRQVFGDSLYFDRALNFASATNNITVLDTLNQSVVKGHYAEVYRDKDSVFITKRAVAITVEQKDSVYIHGDKLIVTGKPEERIIRGYYDVRLFKSDLSGKCDSIHVNQKTGLTQMIRKPVLWSDRSQMTGDSIHLLNNTETEKLDSLKVFQNAFIAQKDTISGYNQVKGERLFGFFNEKNELRQVDVVKNAESISYIRDEKDGSLQGIDKSRSASITIIFEDQEIVDVYKYKGPQGDIWPESQFPEQAQLLQGFNWRGDEQLLSKEDLFKGEPEFELVEIKGLPLPKLDEDFFSIPDNRDRPFIPETSKLRPENLENREEDKPQIGVPIDQEEDQTTQEYRKYLESRSQGTGSPLNKSKTKPLTKKDN